MSERSEQSAPTNWMPTWAFGRAVLLTGLLLIAAVVLGRVDLIVLAVPFALGTAYALRRRPVDLPRVWLSADEDPLVEGGAMTGTVTVGNPGAVSYDVAVLRTRVSPWLRVERAGLAGSAVVGTGRPAGAGRPTVADRPFVTSVAPDTAIDLELAGTALRWGRHPLGPAGARVAAAQGLLISRAVVVEPVRSKVYPKTEPFEAVEVMPRAAGLVGAHHSRRPGEGGELAGVRVFAPGDRLRRIDWRVSLRARQLHVAATLSDRDAEVVVLLDVLAEAGRSGGVTGTASVLDTTVRAAAAIAEHYLHRGDRVALLEYGPSARRLRPATGRRQYLTVLEWLLDVKAQSSPHEPYDHVFGPQLLSADALVVVLTPLLEERSAQMLARLARSGRFVVAVDTLPADLSPPQDRGWVEVAYRLWRLDRDTMIAQLREHGVPVVPWAGTGSLDQVLRDVARLATAPGWVAGEREERSAAESRSREREVSSVMESVIGRVRAVRTAAARISLTPVLVRVGIFLSTLVGLLLAYPAEVVVGRALGPLVAVAVLPAVAPRRLWPTFVALVTVGGWLLATDGYNRPIALWRLMAVAVALYLTHTLCALVAVLPYDAVVDPDVIVRWLTRAAGVLLATSVLGVLLLELAGVRAAEGGWQAVTVAGLLLAVGVTALLAGLLRRR